MRPRRPHPKPPLARPLRTARRRRVRVGMCPRPVPARRRVGFRRFITGRTTPRLTKARPPKARRLPRPNRRLRARSPRMKCRARRPLGNRHRKMEPRATPRRANRQPTNRPPVNLRLVSLRPATPRLVNLPRVNLRLENPPRVNPPLENPPLEPPRPLSLCLRTVVVALMRALPISVAITSAEPRQVIVLAPLIIAVRRIVPLTVVGPRVVARTPTR
jgi:hypothetical protein